MAELLSIMYKTLDSILSGVGGNMTDRSHLEEGCEVEPKGGNLCREGRLVSLLA